MAYEAIIGIEVHIQLATATGMFGGDHNDDSAAPNSTLSPIPMGHPGTLPMVNQEAIHLASLIALACNARLQTEMRFDRKHYFYPDLPKGYQITQFDHPLALGGHIDVFVDDMKPKRISIERLHLEEDAAKSKHVGADTLIDFNRASSPLVELVSKPEMRSSAEAKAFAQELQQIVRCVKGSNADLSKGHMRVDANVSLRPVGDDALYPKTEIKNMNSFRAIERAIDYEIKRQTELWDKSKAPDHTSTRGWDEAAGVTVEQRSKELAADYRYMPEPDIPPITRTAAELDTLKASLPELPAQKRQRFQDEYVLSYSDAKQLTIDPATASFFEQVMSELREWLLSLDDTTGSDKEIWLQYRKKLGRMTANWIQSELFPLVRHDCSQLQFTAENFAELLALLYEKRINSSAGQTILRYMVLHGGDPTVIMQEHDLEQMDNSADISQLVSGIIAANPDVVTDYKAGKDRALMFLVGQVMKATKGKVNPETATEMLKKQL